MFSLINEFLLRKVCGFSWGPLKSQKVSFFTKKGGQKPEKWPFLAPVHRQKGEKRVF